jgi:hypothetical protein
MLGDGGYRRDEEQADRRFGKKAPEGVPDGKRHQHADQCCCVRHQYQHSGLIHGG